MRSNNPIDIELMAAAAAALDTMTNICEYLGIEPSYGTAKRLQEALDMARTELRLEAEQEAQDFLTSPLPPTSND